MRSALDRRFKTMPGKTSLTAFALALLWLFAAPSTTQAGESPPVRVGPPPEQWNICKVGGVQIPGQTAIRGPKRAYFSAAMNASGVPQADIGIAFGAFLAQKYGVENRRGECAASQSRADAEKLLVNWKESDAKYNYGGEIIDTGWQYSPPAQSPRPAGQ
jgi:hypothetical protein